MNQNLHHTNSQEEKTQKVYKNYFNISATGWTTHGLLGD